MLEGIQIIAKPSQTESGILNTGSLILKNVALKGQETDGLKPILENTGNLTIKGSTKITIKE